MELRHATVLFGDLRGFSALLASRPPAAAFELLNRWFVDMSEIAASHGGAIDSFIGDAIMVVFAEARRALECAVDMQLAMAARFPEMFMGIGVNSGEVIAGVLGSKLYSVRTVIGVQVNLAARIEAFCLRGQILVSEAAARECAGAAELGAPIPVAVKGHTGALAVHEVHGIPATGKRVPRQERRRSARVEVRIPFVYRLLSNDVVSQVSGHGMVLDIGYGGVLIELERELGLFEELRLEVQLPFTGYLASDLYGRVVNAQPAGPRFRLGIEFTSLGAETARQIQALVQLLIQGQGPEHRFPL